MERLQSRTLTLTAEGVTKKFGGVTAVDNVTISVPVGRVTGLMGPNGAGKSTLLAVLSGALRPDSGRVQFGDREVTSIGRTRMAAAGVVQTFQKASPLTGLTVLENVLVGMTSQYSGGAAAVFLRPGQLRRQEAAFVERARAIIGQFGLLDHATIDSAKLSFGQLRFLEIARAMVMEPKILLLDEPAAGLNRTEAVLMGQTIGKIREGGAGVLVVDHDVRFLFEICDEIVVMDSGKVIASGPPKIVERDPLVRAAYLSVESSPAEASGGKF